MTGTFHLRCILCRYQETRRAADCREQPICPKCYGPMTLEKVVARKNTGGP